MKDTQLSASDAGQLSETLPGEEKLPASHISNASDSSTTVESPHQPLAKTSADLRKELEQQTIAKTPSASTKLGIKHIIQKIALPAGIELVGTFFLCTLLYTLYGAVGNMFYLSAWIQALMTGVVYASVILMFAKTVRPHLNPAVSLAYALTAKIGYIEMFIRMIAQFCGAAIAGLLLPFLMPSVKGELSHSFYASIANALPDKSVYLKNFAHQNITFSTGSIVALEILLSMVVVAIALQFNPSVSTQKKESPYLYATAMGVAYTVGSVILFAIDGAGLNPARSFGIAMASLRMTFEFNPFTQIWVFILTPLIAAAIVGFLQAFIYMANVATLTTKTTNTSSEEVVSLEDSSLDSEVSSENEVSTKISEKIESAQISISDVDHDETQVKDASLKE